MALKMYSVVVGKNTVEDSEKNTFFLIKKNSRPYLQKIPILFDNYK